MPYDKFSVGVLFENSIVCHVFYAMALGAARVCVVFGVLFCFGLPGPHFFCCGGWVGPGLVFWTVVLTVGSGWLLVCGWLGLVFVGFVWRV